MWSMGSEYSKCCYIYIEVVVKINSLFVLCNSWTFTHRLPSMFSSFFILLCDMNKDILAMYYSADPDMKLKDIEHKSINTSVSYEYIEKKMKDFGIRAYIREYAWYHYKLHHIPQKPRIMYAYWDISCLDCWLLWIVWPRKPSRYADQVMWDFFDDVSKYDLCTISGWAPWIDMLAHKHSIWSNLPTIVVLWWGLLHYMQWHKRWFLDRVVEKWWLILSEFKLLQEPTPWSFPQRNRIIAGLCDMLFLPAAGKKSGSLITVDFARWIGKPVYAVPWSVYDRTSAGSNAYIQEWKVKPITTYSSVLDVYFQKKDVPKLLDTFVLTDDQKQIVSFIESWVVSESSTIAAHIWYTYVDTLAELSMLEVVWVIVYLSDEGVWCLRR